MYPVQKWDNAFRNYGVKTADITKRERRNYIGNILRKFKIVIKLDSATKEGLVRNKTENRPFGVDLDKTIQVDKVLEWQPFCKQKPHKDTEQSKIRIKWIKASNRFQANQKKRKLAFIWAHLEEILRRQVTKLFCLKSTRSIIEALDSVPVYCVVDNRNKVILASNSLQTSNREAWTKTIKFKADNKLLNPISKSWGAFFMSRDDAKIFLDNVLYSYKAGRDINPRKVFGLKIKRVSLGYAYKQTLAEHLDTYFQIIPDLKELDKLISQNMSKARNTFIQGHLHKSTYGVRPTLKSFPDIRVFSKYYGLERLFRPNAWKEPAITALNETQRENLEELFILYTSNFVPFPTLCHKGYFTGVPVYIVRVDGNKRFTHLAASVPKTNLKVERTNLIFFNYDQAVVFCRKNKSTIVNQNNYHNIKTAPYKVRSTNNTAEILVSSLEDYLAFWKNVIQQSDQRDLNNQHLRQIDKLCRSWDLHEPKRISNKHWKLQKKIKAQLRTTVLADRAFTNERKIFVTARVSIKETLADKALEWWTASMLRRLKFLREIFS